MSNIILTGDRPTGRLHLGHLVGSLSQRVQLQNSDAFDEMYIEIAMHKQLLIIQEIFKKLKIMLLKWH